MGETTPGEAACRLEWPLEGVARIVLNRGDALNTLTFEMLEVLRQALDTVTRERARVVIITGSGRAFCGGAHVKYFTSPEAGLAGDPVAIRDIYVRPIIELLRRLQDGAFVTIAEINGYALGGGCELALACDFRLMSDQARIGLTEARLGAVPGAAGIQQLAQLVGRAKALEIMLLGDQWNARKALEIGLVNAVHAPVELPDAALALARRLLACSPVTLAVTKRALYRSEGAGAAEADGVALDAVAYAAGAGEWQEGMKAFVERRAPAFASNGVPGDMAGL